MKPSEALELLKPLWATFTRTAPAPEAMITYAQYVTDLTANALKAAVDEVILTHKFFPAVAEIREVAARQVRSDLPIVEDAWLEVNRKVARYGRYGIPRPTSEGGGYDPVAFSHPAITRAVAVMGWERICDGENESADFAQFRNAYGSYRERELHQAQLGQPGFLLPGDTPALPAGPTPLRALIEGAIGVQSSGLQEG